MRLSLVACGAACGLLAACSSSPEMDDAEWARVQRERLEKLYGVRRPEAAVAGVVAAAPGGAAPRPRVEVRPALQQDPTVPALRTFRVPTHTIDVAYGVGEVGVRVANTQLDDRTSASFVHVGVEASTGVGLHADLWSSDDDLFAGTRISDGSAPAAADTRVSGFDVFPHVLLQPLDGEFRMPVRLGLFVDSHQLDHEPAAVERGWVSAGPRAVVEPTWRFLGAERGVGGAALELVGRVGGDAGPAWFHESFDTGGARDTVARWSGDAGLSLRLLVGGVQAEVGYRAQLTTFDDTHGVLLGDRGNTHIDRSQLFFGLGVTY